MGAPLHKCLREGPVRKLLPSVGLLGFQDLGVSVLWASRGFCCFKILGFRFQGLAVLNQRAQMLLSYA